MFVHQIIQKLAWYPPAETRIPASAFINAIFKGRNDFEQSLCNYLGVNNCVLAGSARALLYLLLETLKKESDHSRTEVLIPGYTCYSVAASVAKAGLKIRTYDLDPRSLHPDMASLRKAAGDKTLAIISQHLFGIPTPLKDIDIIAKNVGAFHIEDAAQALGGKLDEQYLGTMGDFGLYSFGRGKALPVGCGGAIVSKNIEVLNKIKIQRQGVGIFQYLTSLITQIISMPAFYWIPEALPLGLGKTVFDPGFDVSAMNALIDKISRDSLPALENLNNHRRQIAELYKEGFSKNVIIHISTNSTPVYTRFPLIVGKGLINNKLKRLGVRRMYPMAMPEEKIIIPLLADNNEPVIGASEIAKCLITLPTHRGICNELAKDIGKKVKEAYKC